MNLSEPYEFDEIFQEFVRMAEQLFESTLAPRDYSADARPESEPDEVIAGNDRITYLLNAPGYNRDDFLVSVLDDSVEVKTKDFLRRRVFGTTVEPETAETTYRNGVLSVTVRKAGA
jgi:HSP20 family molecular chaperone IbpA